MPDVLYEIRIEFISFLNGQLAVIPYMLHGYIPLKYNSVTAGTLVTWLTAVSPAFRAVCNVYVLNAHLLHE